MSKMNWRPKSADYIAGWTAGRETNRKVVGGFLLVVALAALVASFVVVW